jgi:hypothetical protein
MNRPGGPDSTRIADYRLQIILIYNLQSASVRGESKPEVSGVARRLTPAAAQADAAAAWGESIDHSRDKTVSKN